MLIAKRRLLEMTVKLPIPSIVKPKKGLLLTLSIKCRTADLFNCSIPGVSGPESSTLGT